MEENIYLNFIAERKSPFSNRSNKKKGNKIKLFCDEMC